MTESLSKKVGIASLIMMTSVFLSRVIGLFREMVIAHIGGARAPVDAYQIAFVIPEILNHIVASGFMSVTFIPIFSRYLAGDREEEGWKVFSVILNCFGCFLVLLILFAVAFTPELIALIAPGLSNPDTIALAVRMTRIILPAQLFFFVGGLLMAVQFSKESFFIPALAPLLYNLGIISGGILLGPWLGMEGFAWGVLIGALVGNLIVQFFGVRKAGLKYFFIFDLFHPDFRKYLILTLPLMVGLTMTFSTEFFLRLFGSYLPQGSIAILNFGLRIMLILVGLFGQAVGTASFPFLARLVVENRLNEMNRLLNQTLRFLALVIPFSILLMVLRSEVVRMIFQRGKIRRCRYHSDGGGFGVFTGRGICLFGLYHSRSRLFCLPEYIVSGCLRNCCRPAKHSFVSFGYEFSRHPRGGSGNFIVRYFPGDGFICPLESAKQQHRKSGGIRLLFENDMFSSCDGYFSDMV